MAQTTMINLKTPQNGLWPEAGSTACLIGNRLVMQGCKKYCTSHEVIQGRKSNIRHCRILDSGLFFYEPTKMRAGKLDTRANERILVRYCKGDAYGIILWRGKTIVQSQGVKICENEQKRAKSVESFIEFDLFNLEVMLNAIEYLDNYTNSLTLSEHLNDDFNLSC